MQNNCYTIRMKKSIEYKKSAPIQFGNIDIITPAPYSLSMGKKDSELWRQYKDFKKAGKEMAEKVSDSFGLSKKSNTFKWIKEKIIRAKKKSSVNFPVHLTAFVAVNAFLMALNFTIAGPYPWFYFALGGWGIGLLSHLRSFLNKRREAKEVEKIESMPDKLFRVFRRMQKSISRFRHHATAFFSVNAYVFGINMITSSSFLWVFFVTGPWAAGLLAHWVAYTARKKILKAELKAVGIDIKQLRRTGISLKDIASDNYQNLYTKAVELKDTILKEIQADKNLKMQWGELEPALNKYTAQIKDLMHKSSELDKILATCSLLDLEQELSELKEKQTQAETTVLKNEYRRSIAQFEKHRKSIIDIVNQKELITLRLSSSIALLNQMKLDTVRMKHAQNIGENYSFKELQQKTDEIQEYLVHFQDEMDKLEQT